MPEETIASLLIDIQQQVSVLAGLVVDLGQVQTDLTVVKAKVEHIDQLISDTQMIALNIQGTLGSPGS